MARKRKDDIDSFKGIFLGEEQTEPIEGQLQVENGKLEEVKPKKEPKAKTQAEPKRKGRPKLQNRELRKRYSFTILPSLYEKAQDKAGVEGKTLSELITDFLTEYTEQ